MKQYRIIILLILLPALLAAALSGCGEGVSVFSPAYSAEETDDDRTEPFADSAAQGDLIVWYAEDCPAAPLFEILLEGFLSSSVAQRIEISLVVYATEESMEQALEKGTPDVLMGSADLAARLRNREMMTDLGAYYRGAMAIRKDIAQAWPGAGEDFIPLCGTLNLLGTCRSITAEYGPDTAWLWDLNKVCGAAYRGASEGDGTRFETASYADLFDMMLRGTSPDFDGKFSGDEDFLKAYNCLAELYFEGALEASDSQTPARLEDGTVSFAFLPAAEFGRMSDAAGLEFSYPLPEGAEKEIRCRLYGIGVLTKEKSELAAELVWRLYRAASVSDVIPELGMLPAMECRFPDTALGRCMEQLYTGYGLDVMRETDDYYVNRSTFDDEFLSAVYYLQKD